MEIKQEQIPNTKAIQVAITIQDIELSYILTGYVKEEYRQNYFKIWEYLSRVEDKIKIAPIGDNYILYLPSQDYWHIYKKLPSGKNFLTKFSFQDRSGAKYIFPTPGMYFDSTFSKMAGGKGVYGIYYRDQLIYIEYTLRGFQIRWDEHRECFKRRDSSNPMYQACFLEDIEFRELITEEDIQEVFYLNTPVDRPIFQIIEYSLIKTLKPIYNKEGLTIPYKLDITEAFKAQDKVSKIRAIQRWLQSDSNLFEDDLISPEEVWE